MILNHACSAVPPFFPMPPLPPPPGAPHGLALRNACLIAGLPALGLYALGMLTPGTVAGTAAFFVAIVESVGATHRARAWPLVTASLVRPLPDLALGSFDRSACLCSLPCVFTRAWPLMTASLVRLLPCLCLVSLTVSA